MTLALFPTSALLPRSEGVTSAGARNAAPRKRRSQADQASARIAAMPVLPLFHKLEGRRVVLIGGSDAACWKAELLSAAGAEVHAYAETLSDGFASLIKAGPVSGAIHHHRSQPQGADLVTVLAGAALALADAETDSEAAAFHAAAASCGVPCNVIDKPQWCDFQFGSIVNRAPTIVAISTDGAAPVLGQAIRRRIETILPAAIGRWTSLAAAIRDEVASRLSPGAPRRAFWTRFAERAFAPEAEHLSDDAIKVLIEQDFEATQTCGQTGRVSLIVAPQGDPELLTIKAARALQSADVLMYDTAIDAAILHMARREAHRVEALADAHQADEQLLALVGQGHHVVRIVAEPAIALDRLAVQHGFGLTIFAAIVPEPAIAAKNPRIAA